MLLWAWSAEYVICRMYCRMYARACCTCNRTVQTFTHHFHRNSLLSSYSSWSTWSSPSRSPASRRSTSEAARTGQYDHSGSQTPRTCSSYMLLVHARCVVPKQTGTGKARQVDSGLGNYLLFISHHLMGQLDMDGFHKRFTNVSVHQIRMQTAPAVSSHEAWHLT